MTEQERKPIYSPLQVAACTLLAGPMGGTHLLWSNFNSLGKSREAKITAAVGVSITVLLLIYAFVSSSRVNLGFAIGLMLALSGRFAAEIYQLKKGAIADSPEYRFQSNWKVFWIGLGWLATLLAIAVLVSLVLVFAGVDIEG